MPGADGGDPPPWAACQAERKASASVRLHSKHGRWPAASAVTSSMKNNSVYPAPMTWRCRDLNASTQHIHCLELCVLTSDLVAGSCSLPPRLPISMPRSGDATISPSGLTLFCNTIVLLRPGVVLVEAFLCRKKSL